MKRRTFAVILPFAFAAALLAHGGAEHVIGVVKAVSAASLTVETPKHETVTIFLTAKTEVMKSNAKAEITQLKVGDRVVVHAVKNKAGALEASEVTWGAVAASAG